MNYDSILWGIIRKRWSWGWQEERKVKANGRTGIKIFRMKPYEKYKKVSTSTPGTQNYTLTTSKSQQLSGDREPQGEGHPEFLSLKMRNVMSS